MEMNSYLKWWLKIHTRVAEGKNFIHTHPLGDELYSCDVLLIDQNIGKIIKELKKKKNSEIDHHQGYE